MKNEGKNNIPACIRLTLSMMLIPAYTGNPNKEMGMQPNYMLNILAKKNFTQNEMTSPERHANIRPALWRRQIYMT